jgi:serine protease Do
VDVGHIRDGWLGLVELEDVPGTAGAVMIKSLMGKSNEGGGAPAWEAGLRPGDIITRFENRELHGRKHLLSFIRRGEIGRTVTLQRDRKGQVQEVQVTIREIPKRGDQTIYAPPPGFGPLGLKVGDSKRGAIVRDVAIGGPAYVAQVKIDEKPVLGIAIGDVIKQLNKQRIESAADFERVQQQIQPGSNVSLIRERQGKDVFVNAFVKIQTVPSP